VQRENTFRSLAKGFLENVFDGAMDEYVIHALQGKKLSAAEIERLEELIAQAKEKSPGRSRKSEGGRP
jgi:predicted transcriptional regulator